MNIILAGMPGCGKSTVSAALESYFGFKAVDTDGLIVQKYGPIPEIFEKFGEEGFRLRESEAVKSLKGCDGFAIATGGGCLLREENVRAFKECGKIVYLRTSLEELEKRLQGDNTRPLLAGDLKKKLAGLYRGRSGVYGAAADITVDTDGLTPREICQRIMEEIR